MYEYILKFFLLKFNTGRYANYVVKIFGFSPFNFPCLILKRFLKYLLR